MSRTKAGPSRHSRRNKIKKRCMYPECGRIYEDISSLSVKPANPDKPQLGICPKCKHLLSTENHYSEEDWGGVEIGLENE